MNHHDAEILRAVKDCMDQRLSVRVPDVRVESPTVHNRVETPEVHVTNEVRASEVHVTNEVNTDAIAEAVTEALDRMSEAMATMMGKMVEVITLLEKRLSVEVKPVFNVPEQKAAKREKRSFKIKHDDGSTSVVSEE